MVAPDYNQLLEGIFSRMTQIMRERSDLDAETAKLTQLLHATANMLPDDQRNAILEKWTAFFQTQLHRETSLIDSVRKVMQEGGREWLTVSKVRDRLITSGFDFSEYVSNPLASVSATLIRLKDKGELEPTTVEGVAAYRWDQRAARLRRRKLRTAFGGYPPATPTRIEWGKGFGSTPLTVPPIPGTKKE
jgi:hypothetical protein